MSFKDFAAAHDAPKNPEPGDTPKVQPAALPPVAPDKRPAEATTTTES